MDRTRPIPPDPVDASQTPVEGVEQTAAEAGSTRSQPQDQTQFAENEGLANTSRPEAAGDVERPSVDPRDEMAGAAQRGRTA